MGWTTPTDRATSYVAAAADWNIIEDNLTYLYGDIGWTTITPFSNSWVAGTNTPRFRRQGNLVSMQGNMTSGTIGAVTAFTLPVNYRPNPIGGSNLQIPCASNLTLGIMVILGTGVVQARVGSNVGFEIDCTFDIT